MGSWVMNNSIATKYPGEKDVRGRRLVAIQIPMEILGDFFKDTLEECIFWQIKGIPRDAKFLSMNLIPEYALVHLVYEHETFPFVMDGEIIPTMDIYYTKYYA